MIGRIKTTFLTYRSICRHYRLNHADKEMLYLDCLGAEAGNLPYFLLYRWSEVAYDGFRLSLDDHRLARLGRDELLYRRVL